MTEIGQQARSTDSPNSWRQPPIGIDTVIEHEGNVASRSAQGDRNACLRRLGGSPRGAPSDYVAGVVSPE